MSVREDVNLEIKVEKLNNDKAEEKVVKVISHYKSGGVILLVECRGRGA